LNLLSIVRSIVYLREAAAVQKPLCPAEMVELFKVLAMTRRTDDERIGFCDGDRRRRL
jgi:hypothetical protein